MQGAEGSKLSSFSPRHSLYGYRRLHNLDIFVGLRSAVNGRRFHSRSCTVRMPWYRITAATAAPDSAVFKDVFVQFEHGMTDEDKETRIVEHVNLVLPELISYDFQEISDPSISGRGN